MILNYTQQKDNYIASTIAEISGDSVINLYDKIKSGDKSPIFSESPYILIADYNQIAKFKALFKMGFTPYLGSKIFYFIAVCNEKDNCFYNVCNLAKDICAVKNMVLFGCDVVQEVTEGSGYSEQQILKVNQLGACFRDSVPFNSNKFYDYPCRFAIK